MTRFTLFALVLLWALIRPSVWAQTAPAQVESPSAQVDKLFEKMDKTISPGCAVAAMKDGKILYERGYGMADLDHNVPITPTTVFHVASMSKQFTAASIVMLAQERKLSLDDEVRKYVPELPDFGVPITIRELVHHTSGLRDQWDLLGLAGWRYSLDLITDEDVLSIMSRQKDLNFPPGSKHMYCNTGYTLLAQVVKRVSGSVVPRVYDVAHLPAARYEELALPRRSRRDRQEHGLRIRAGEGHFPNQYHEFRYRRSYQPPDDGRRPSTVGREFLQPACGRAGDDQANVGAWEIEQWRATGLRLWAGCRQVSRFTNDRPRWRRCGLSLGHDSFPGTAFYGSMPVQPLS